MILLGRSRGAPGVGCCRAPRVSGTFAELVWEVRRLMKVVVLGAGGGVGRHVVRSARSRGHEVTVLARHGRPIECEPEVRVVRGELADPAAVDEAFAGATAVLSSIGMQRRHPANPWSRSVSPRDLTSRTAGFIVEGMRRCGVPRVVAVSAAGVGDSAARLNLLMRFFLATTMIGRAYRDLAAMEEVYGASGLDWLCPRPVRLTDGEADRETVVVDAFETSAQIPRAAVARWMLDALDRPDWPDAAWGGRTPQIAAGPARAPED